VNMTVYFMAGDIREITDEGFTMQCKSTKSTCCRGTKLTSCNTATAGPTYTFHSTDVIIVSTIRQSDSSSCEGRDQSRSRGAGYRLLLLLLSIDNDGSKP
jgi:hypothetical protein